MDNIIKAPFTKDQVKNLNEFQSIGFMHPFTCGNDHSGDNLLVATENGWVCPTCTYTQDWAYTSMTNVEIVKESFFSTDFGKIYKEGQEKRNRNNNGEIL